MKLGNMEIVVIAEPTMFEIREMLDEVEIAQRLRGAELSDILPVSEDMSFAEYLRAGWCYLWYDAETLAPIGYTLFAFPKRKERYPMFLMGGTRFCGVRHILKIRRAMLAVMRNAFKNRVCAYIDSERIAKFAGANGFKKLKTKEFIWAKAAEVR